MEKLYESSTVVIVVYYLTIVVKIMILVQINVNKVLNTARPLEGIFA